MKKMKTNYLPLNKSLVAVLAIGAVVGLNSCKDKVCLDPEALNYDEDGKKECDDCCEYAANEEVSKNGEITSDETWSANNIYILEGKVVVQDGATLTIEAGTIIKGAEGLESQASALVIARGGKIMAEGTADNPIIFTSVLDNITYGEKVGTNLGKTDNEKWGGIVILGKAPVSTENGDTEGNIEGINPEDGFGKYGGTDAADNSGVMKYVSIRHGGITIGEGNELNGLTCGGVGSGTTLENIEIYATLDDGVEFFGGTVNASNVLVFYQGDDGIDIDQNYSGTVSNFAVIHGDGIGTDEGLEIDGPEGSTYTDGKFTLSNGICMSDGTSDGSASDFKSKAQGTITNVTFDYSSLGNKAVKIRASYNSDCTNKSDALAYMLDGTLKFNNCKMDGGISVYENNDPEVCGVENTANQAAAEAVLTTGSGATLDINSTFGSWTAAGMNNEL